MASSAQVSTEDLIAAQAAIAAKDPTASFSPVVDGEVLPRHPFDPDAPEISKDIPMIIGFTLDDAALRLTNFDLDEGGIEGRGEARCGRPRRSGARRLPRGIPRRAALPGASAHPDRRRFGRGALLQAERKAAQGGAPVYLYLWAWPSPGMGGKFGAVHGVDVGLAFHNFAGEITGGGTPEGKLMADRLASAWVAFARTGNPNNPQIPEWPAYNATTKPTMIFDADTRVVEDPKRDLRAFWSGEDS